MQRLISEKTNRWLLPTVLILFILEVITLPLILGITYSGRSESPDHVLTYTKGELTWDSATGIDENGAAELDLFDAVYDESVVAENGENLVAPGTKGFNIVRLKNSVSGSVNYKAVLYEIRTNELLPVKAALDGTFTDTVDYPLPDGVTEDQVVRAVTGSVKGGEIVDFDISWLWSFYESGQQDVIDTMLGTQDELDRVTMGLYIVVEDNNSYVNPDIPDTGDDRHVGGFIALMVISLLVLILLIWDRRRSKQCEK